MTISWNQLLADVGADRPNSDPYILFKGREPVACALRPDLNPGAPTEILVGDEPVVVGKANRLLAFGGSIPVYIKRDPNVWDLAGVYGNPVMITDASVYRANLAIRLAVYRWAKVAFAIHMTQVIR
jgi:hypothetical protein